ncbi:MAG: hypothetical protein HYV60_04245, partial [Planctomycetia bacterium]|nr:hypothetical protein [Planctomycetia bacterium]
VPVGGAAAITEGETFTIRDNQTNALVTFEFDTDGSFTFGNRAVTIAVGNSADQVASAIALAIQQAVTAGLLSGLTPVTVGGGNVHVGGTVGTAHTIDMTGTINATQMGLPGVAPGNSAIGFLPTDTADQIAIRVAAAINLNSSLTVNATIDTTIGNGVQLGGSTFNPGNSPLIPQGNIPIFVDRSQSPADVAEQIAQAIRLSTLGSTVTPHFNNHANLDANRINLEGAAAVLVSAGAAARLQVQGAVGVAGSNVPVNIHSGMTRTQVATVIDGAIENLFFNPQIVTSFGLDIFDGDSFVLEDNVNAPVTFEFESGFLLQVPPAGSNESFGGIQDGITFTIRDPNDSSVPTLVFEFDKDHLTDPFGTPTVALGNIPIRIPDNASATTVARSIVNAVAANPNSAILGLTPRILDGGLLQLGGRAGQVLSFTPGSGLTRTSSTPFILEIPAAGGDFQLGGIRDGATFTITDGGNSVTFEFNQVGGVGTDANGNTHRAVNIGPTFTQAQVASAILTALNRATPGTDPFPVDLVSDLGVDLRNTAALNNGTRVRITGLPGPRLELSEGNNVTQPVSEPGVNPTVSMFVPETLTISIPESLRLHVPAVGGMTGGVVDGDTFLLDDDVTDLIPGLVFEFDGNGSVGVDANGISHVPIFFTNTDNADTVALSILDAIATRPQLALAPTKFGGAGNIDLGGTGASLILPISSRMIRTGPFAFQVPAAGGGVGGIADGSTFDIDITPLDATPSTRFEFDSDGSFNAANVRIGFLATDDATQVANKIMAAVAATFSTLHPALMEGAAGLEIGGFANTSLVTNNRSAGIRGHVTQTGKPGALLDSNATSFVIRDGVNPQVLFSFDVDGANPVNSVPIVLNASPTSQNLATTNQIASAIINAIAGAGVGLTPRYLGNGNIHLGGTSLHQLNTAFSQLPALGQSGPVGLTQSGQGGPIADGETFTVTVGGTVTTFEFDSDTTTVSGNVPVAFTTDQSTAEVTQTIITSLRNNVGNLFPRNFGNELGVIDFGGNQNHVLDTSGTVNLSQDGVVASQSPRVPVVFSPSSQFQGANVATAMANAINNTAP